MSKQLEIRFNYRWKNWRVGSVVMLPSHVANEFLNGDAPNGLKWASLATEAAPAEKVEETPPAAPAEDLDQLTVKQLKERLSDAGLPTKGNKAALLKRLAAK